MKKQITHISVHQTSKVFSIIYFLVALIIGLLAGVYFLVSGELMGVSSVFGYIGGVFLAAFLYLIITYILFAISLWFYNFVARSFGGIEFNLEDK